MLRQATFTDNREAKFISSLASDVVRMKAPVRITAVDTSTDDEAYQTAQAYWMMGWGWEEIESILIDQGYTESQAVAAIKKTKEYAEATLNEGPFSLYSRGQLIKLISGHIGRVASIAEDFVSIKLINIGKDEDGDDIYQINADQIDVEASTTLKKAFLLRRAATKLLKLAQKEEYELPGAPTEFEEVEVSPDVPVVYKPPLRRKKDAPPGWGELAPEIGEVEPVDKIVAKIVNNLDGLKEMRDELKSQMSKIRRESLDPLSKQVKELTAEEQTELKNLFLVVGEVEEGIDSLDHVIFGEYENQIVGFRTKVVEQEAPIGVQDELDALKKILADNHPRIAKGVLAALEEYREAYTTVDRAVEKTFAKFPFREKPRKKSRVNAQAIERIKEFLQGVWDKVKAVSSALYEKVFPVAEETTEALKEFNALAGTQTAKVRISAAMEMVRR